MPVPLSLSSGKKPLAARAKPPETAGNMMSINRLNALLGSLPAAELRATKRDRQRNSSGIRHPALRTAWSSLSSKALSRISHKK
jgi:hypothetical protein